MDTVSKRVCHPANIQEDEFATPTQRNEAQIQLILDMESRAYWIANRANTTYALAVRCMHVSDQIANGLAELYRVAQKFQTFLNELPMESLPQSAVTQTSDGSLLTEMDQGLLGQRVPIGNFIEHGATKLQDGLPDVSTLTESLQHIIPVVSDYIDREDPDDEKTILIEE